MNKQSKECYVNRGSDGGIMWAIVYVENAFYAVYYRNRPGADFIWSKEDCAEYQWLSAERFIGRCRAQVDSSVSRVRHCVVRKFLKEFPR